MSYKKYVKNKDVPKFDLGGIYFPYGQTIDDPTNPFWYINLDYVPSPYIPFDIDSELELLKKPSYPKPDLDFSKLKEKLDKDLLPAEKDAIMGEFNKIERELREYAMINPYWQSDRNAMALYNKLINFYNSPQLQKMIDNKNIAVKVGDKLKDDTDYFAFDANGMPLPITNGQVSGEMRKKIQEMRPYTMGLFDFNMQDKTFNNLVFTPANRKEFVQHMDKITNTGQRVQARAKSGGGFSYGQVLLNTFLPIIHSESYIDVEHATNLVNLNEVQASVLQATTSSDSVEQARRNLQSAIGTEATNSLIAEAQYFKHNTFGKVGDILQMSLALNKNNIENIEKLDEYIKETKEKINKETNPKKKEALEDTLKSLEANKAQRERSQQLIMGYGNFKKAIEALNKLPYGKELMTLLEQEDDLKLQYTLRMLFSKSANEQTRKQAMMMMQDLPFMKALLQVGKEANVDVSPILQEIYKGLEATDLHVISNIVTQTTELMKKQKTDIKDKRREGYDSQAFLVDISKGLGGRDNKDKYYKQSEEYRSWFLHLFSFDDKDKKFWNSDALGSLFGVASDIFKKDSNSNTIEVFEKVLNNLTRTFKDQFDLGADVGKNQAAELGIQNASDNLRSLVYDGKRQVIVVDSNGKEYIINSAQEAQNGNQIIFENNPQQMKIVEAYDYKGNKVGSQVYVKLPVAKIVGNDEIAVVDKATGKATTIDASDVKHAYIQGLQEVDVFNAKAIGGVVNATPFAGSEYWGNYGVKISGISPKGNLIEGITITPTLGDIQENVSKTKERLK